MFCSNCGSVVKAGTAFCANCGSAVKGAGTPMAPSAPAPASKKTSPILKFVVAGLAVLFLVTVLVVAGIVYAGYRVKQKAEQMAKSSGIDLSSLASDRPSGRAYNACALLTKEEASAALGVEIARAEGSGSKCEYYTRPVAEEQRGERFRKALEAMKQRPGAEEAEAGSEMEQMRRSGVEDVAKAFASGANDGSIPYVTITVDENGKTTMAAMKLAMGAIGGSETVEKLEGIGDEAILGPMSSMLVFIKSGASVEIDLRQVSDGRDRGIAMAKRIAARM